MADFSSSIRAQLRKTAAALRAPAPAVPAVASNRGAKSAKDSQPAAGKPAPGGADT